jgi:branched-subunit amino acid transport protein AzlD
MDSKTNNTLSGVRAGAIAAVIFVLIWAFWQRSLSLQVVIGGLGLGLFVFVVSFVIGSLISARKAH